VVWFEEVSDSKRRTTTSTESIEPPKEKGRDHSDLGGGFGSFWYSVDLSMNSLEDTQLLMGIEWGEAAIPVTPTLGN
jgi:hypothetical protein